MTPPFLLTVLQEVYLLRTGLDDAGLFPKEVELPWKLLLKHTPAARSTSVTQSRTELMMLACVPSKWSCRGSYMRRLGFQRSSSKKRQLQPWRKVELLLKQTRAARNMSVTQLRTELDDAGLCPERVELLWELYEKARASEEEQREAPAAALADEPAAPGATQVHLLGKEAVVIMFEDFVKCQPVGPIIHHFGHCNGFSKTP